MHAPALQHHVFGLVLFPVALGMAKASRDEWLLTMRLLLHLPRMVLFPHIQLTMLYNYFSGRHDLVPEDLLSVEQREALNLLDKERDVDNEK